ncbi:MAG TPA: SpoIIE family protein phosphatase [Chloroflexota bacterium]|nr:SpoIIE family protein phosphatase [Chloroflexota bacterium]
MIVSQPETSLRIEVAVAKLSKYAVRESGDTVEVTERPHGGISVVLADGQGSGKHAKTLSNMVAKKAINLLADGTRDGAAARAVNDFLFAYRHGQVSAELAIVSADLVTRSIVISRNTRCPAILAQGGDIDVWAEASTPIGIYGNTKPVIRELGIDRGITVVIYSDGIHGAGQRRATPLDPVPIVRHHVERAASAQAIADALLTEALARDEGRAADDMSVAVLAVREVERADGARRLALYFPLG